MRCPVCHKTKITIWHILGHEAGKTTGKTKARDPEKMRQAVMVRWRKHAESKNVN